MNAVFDNIHSFQEDSFLKQIMKRFLKRISVDAIHDINAAARPIDRKFFAPRIVYDSDPLFIVGVARSGSTLLFQVLAHSLRVSYLPRILDYGYGFSNFTMRLCSGRLARHRPLFQSHLGSTPGLLSPSEAYGFWRKWLWKGHNEDHVNESPLATLAGVDLRKAIHEIQAHNRAPLLVKCLYLSLSVPALATAFPESRFIFLKRDPLDIAISSIRSAPTKKLRGWWSTRPLNFSEHMNEPVTDRIMWQISEIATQLAHSLEDIDPRRWRSITYENLCSDPHEVVSQLSEWLEPVGFKRWSDNVVPDHFKAAPKSGPAVEKLRDTLKQSPYYERTLQAMQV